MSLRLRLDKPWQKLTAETAQRLPGQLGVYQVADAEGIVLFIGQAGARSPLACAPNCSVSTRNAATAASSVSK